MGDTILSSACLHALKDSGASLYFATSPAFADLFQSSSAFTFVPMDAHFKATLKKLAPDISFQLHPDRAVAALIQEAGVPRRIGFEQDKPYLSDAIAYPKDKGTKHELEYCMELIRVVFADLKTPQRLKLDLPASENTAFTQSVFVHGGSFGNKAHVPTPILEELCEHATQLLAQRSGQAPTVIIVGSGEDRALNQNLLKALSKRGIACQDTTGTLSLQELACALQQGQLFIGRDSGPAHLAAAVGCPSFCIIPSTRPDTSPTRWRPLGEAVEVFTLHAKPYPWEKNTKAAQRAFKKLDPAQVIAQMEAFLRSL